MPTLPRVQPGANQDITSRVLTNDYQLPTPGATVSPTIFAARTVLTLPLIGATTVNPSILNSYIGDELVLLCVNNTGTLSGTPLSTTISNLSQPTGLAVVGSTTGGTIAAGTYYYKVAAYNISGESIASAEVSVTNTGATSSNALSWNAVAGAIYYKIYRGTATGAENVFYTSATNSFTDTNAAAAAVVVTTGANVSSIGTLSVTAGKKGTIYMVFDGATWVETGRAVTV